MTSLGLRTFPGKGMEPVADRQLEELMPGGVKLDQVDPVAVAVVRVKLGGVAVGEKAPLVDLGRGETMSKLAQFTDCPVAAVSLERVDQGRFGSRQVVLFERRRLV